MNNGPVPIPIDSDVWSPPRRLLGLPPYPLADVPDMKARLVAEGGSVIDLGVGDPGLPVPVPSGQPPWAMKPWMTRWNLIPS